MNDFNSDSAHPYKQRLSRPPSTPASSCFKCHRPGIVSTDQTGIPEAAGGKWARQQIRFECVCSNSWLTSKPDAEAHGRFLDRAGLRP